MSGTWCGECGSTSRWDIPCRNPSPKVLALRAKRRLEDAAPDLLDAALAGGRYSNALVEYQRRDTPSGMVDGTDELERLFEDWHNKTHAAIAKAKGGA